MKPLAYILSPITLLLSVIICGCGSSPGPTMQWAQLSEQSSCEAMDPSSCPSAFGFTVDAQGNFTAGPSPSGKIIQGAITAQELSTLNADANAILLTGAAQHCQSSQEPAGSSDAITASSAANMRLNIYSDNALKGTCFAHSEAAATALRDFFHQLQGKYYPVPFPS